jgi:pyruvate/2-oxoglutarate dehydrogenase complex dihydrolipoamide acyltransferase (E2) component
VAGTITKITAGDGQTVKVGTPLAEIDEEPGRSCGRRSHRAGRCIGYQAEPAPAACAGRRIAEAPVLTPWASRRPSLLLLLH